MFDTIGEVAGKIWEYLNENGATTIAGLKKNLDLKADQAILSLGWLAREGKVKFKKAGNSVKVGLK